MELRIKEDYELDNLVKDWGFKKSTDWDYDVYYKESNDHSSVIQIWSDRDVFVHQRIVEMSVDDEILCLLYDLIQAGIIIKV